MEDEEEDEEEEEPSRTPAVGGRKDRSSHHNGRKGQLSDSINHVTTSSETRDAISEHSFHCEPSIGPLCQGELYIFPSCQGNALAEQIDMMTVRNTKCYWFITFAAI